MTREHSQSRGRYAEKQLYSPSRLIAFSHRSRFELARELVAPYAGRRLLDYGCGDGTFLERIVDLFPGAIGADIDRNQLDDCRRRLGAKRLDFCHTSELIDAGRRFDLIVCMETLEHCLAGAVTEILSDLRRLSDAAATVVISVPIEIGPPLLLKQAARRVMGWRKIGEYAYMERYSPLELLTMVFATDETRIERPAYAQAAAAGGAYHGHKGFNWKALRRELERSFEVEAVRFSPFGWSRGFASSQVWFVCSPKPAE
jgi:2-polyprenyl-3-methyl-5-hydroxy-6-metoxy-1,4-benzoquinol methylase